MHEPKRSRLWRHLRRWGPHWVAGVPTLEITQMPEYLALQGLVDEARGLDHAVAALQARLVERNPLLAVEDAPFMTTTGLHVPWDSEGAAAAPASSAD